MNIENHQNFRNFQLLHSYIPFIDEKTEVEDKALIEDPLEEMLHGIELNRELSSPSIRKRDFSPTTIEGKNLEKQIKHLRFYLNEAYTYFELDE